MDTDYLHEEYLAREPDTRRFQKSVVEQIEHLLATGGVSLGVPLETRIKTWDSISDKLQRKSLNPDHIFNLDDLIGIRLILLFRKDIQTVSRLINATFQVMSEEDTGGRLGDTQFGYQSKHFVLGLPRDWLNIPTLHGLEAFRCEVQVRSLAQHIWAAASHKLQYKREANVPPPLRRTINRISALLETVDLEFDRVLEERAVYLNDEIPTLSADEPLNVDILEKELDALLPNKNKSGTEKFDELLSDLTVSGITSVTDLRNLVSKHKDAVLADEAEQISDRLAQMSYHGTTKERIESGVFFNYMGLVRAALRHDIAPERKNKKAQAIAKRK